MSKRKPKDVFYKTHKKLSWKPVRRGLVYCAPACGRGCTIKEYNAATAAANKLATRLGPGWKPVLTENLGWHWKVVSANVHVHEHSPKSFSAHIHRPGDIGIIWSGDSFSPRRAIQTAIALAQGEIDWKTRLLDMAKTVK